MTEAAADPLPTVNESDELPKTKESLQEYATAASIHYSTKNFAAAAESYANAVEVQAALNGEMAPENAELLFYYGRALYKVAVAKSDVLGNKVAQEDKKKTKAKKAAKTDTGESSTASNRAKATAASKEESVESKPYFQLQGDENWTDSEEEEEEEESGEEEEQDDLADAYETFELARVLYSKQLETLEGEDAADKGKSKADLSPKARAIKEKIADCHGFLVEISLENERFHDAISDARSSLALQEELNPFEHENVTESHYSLSLALEFASVLRVREDQAGRSTDTPADATNDFKDSIDWDLRKEAAKHTELAIQSLEARLKKEEGALSSDTLTPEQRKEKTAIVEDKKNMLEELRTRVADLNADPTKQQIDSIDPTVFQGLLGGLLGADAETQKAKIAEATKSANDVTGLVKTKKKAKPMPAPAAQEGSSGKRKLETDEGDANGKRAKTEELI